LTPVRRASLREIDTDPTSASITWQIVAPVRFLFDLNSPYAYLAAERIGSVIDADVAWQPIVFGALLRAQQRRPWSMRADERGPGIDEVARRASQRDLPAVVYPAGWPVECYSVPALRVATWALLNDEESGRAVTLHLFRELFIHGRALKEPEALAGAAAAAGVGPEEIVAALDSEEVRETLRLRTEAAIAAGVEGVPTVAVGDQLFWGDDRLEDAAAACSVAT
jgi:2-hydroxychromene-2-carboxylate isomerase